MKMCNLRLTNAIVFDGTGQARRQADVLVHQGVIRAVGQCASVRAECTIDLQGLALSPGFIDVHTHDDRLLLSDPMMMPKLSQGVTTVITGNCGISLAPLGKREAIPPLNLVANGPEQRFDSFADYFRALESAPPAVNMAALVGHTTLRAATMGNLDLAANAAEIACMQALVSEALKAGVLGLSTGTYYAPAQAATSDEIRAVCEPLRGTQALIASHIRDEGDRVLQAMTETMAIANSLGLRQVLSHHKVLGRANFGRSLETLALLDEARERGDVCLDCYPYTASSTVLRKDAVEQASRTLIAWSKSWPAASGRYVDDLLKDCGLDLDSLITTLQPAGAIYFSMDEADVERILAHPQTMIASDGLPHDTFPHPRLWGTFPRVLGYYARERKLFSLETAIYKMTGLSASRFGLPDRGLIQPGHAADLVVFDPDLVRDRASFADPMQAAAGIHRVYVNGVLAWFEGQNTGARAGQVVRRAAARETA